MTYRQAWLMVVVLALVAGNLFLVACQPRPKPTPLPPPVTPAPVVTPDRIVTPPLATTRPPPEPPTTFDTNRVFAAAAGLPVLDAIQIGVGVEHANGTWYRWFPAKMPAQDSEPYSYIESRVIVDNETQPYMCFNCVGYDAEWSEMGRWKLSYSTKYGFRGLRFLGVLIHANWYGADIRLIEGDVNSDGVVNRTDVSAVANHNGQTTNADNCQYDVNLDGVINNTDKAMVAELMGG